MGYSASQKRIAALELARMGKVDAAIERLRNEYDSFRNIGSTTLWRWMQDPEFAETIAEQSKILRESEIEAIREIERQRVITQQQNSIREKMAEDERFVAELKDMIRDKIKSLKDEITVTQLRDLLKLFWAKTESRWLAALPAISDDEEMSIFLESVSKEVYALLPADKAKKLIKSIQDTYRVRKETLRHTVVTAEAS